MPVDEYSRGTHDSKGLALISRSDRGAATNAWTIRSHSPAFLVASAWSSTELISVSSQPLTSSCYSTRSR